MTLTYRFKPLPELGWAVLTAVLLVLLPALVALDPEKITDWRTWAVALGGAVLRAAAGAALDYVRRSATVDPEPSLADEIISMPKSEREALRIELERRWDEAA